jgi:hypothetical protein
MTIKTSSLVLILLFVTSALAQTSSTVTANANRTWPAFWQQFTTAIHKRDKDALKKMMPEDFFDGGGGMTPAEWLQYIDENARNGSWRDLRRSVALRTKTNRNWSSKGVPTRVTRDNGYYFEFRKDKKWYFAGVVGD